MFLSQEQRSNNLAGILVLAFLLTAAPSVAFQIEAPRQRPDTVRLASEFIQTIYPELLKRNAHLAVTAHLNLDSTPTWLPTLVCRVTDLPPAYDRTITDSPGKPKGRVAPQLLHALFVFGADGRPVAFNADTVKREDHLKFRKLAQANPAWTQSDIARALREAGARYGPDQEAAFRAQLPIAALERLLGKTTILELRFLAPDESGDPAGALLDWEVEIAVGTRPRRMDHYVLRFEPFGGKLYSLHRPPAF